MAKGFQFSHRADLRPIVGDKKIIASSIGPSGEAVLLTVAPEFEKAPFGRQEAKGFASFPLSQATPQCPATYIRFDGHTVLQKTELKKMEFAFPFIQPLPHGHALVVGSRCHFRKGDPEKNATVFDKEGNVLRSFVMGDGINTIQTTADGAIWASYFDEGIFGNFGWDQPIGASGLVCFDGQGQIGWKFFPPDGFDCICDCYALNVANDAVWACYYTDFPLVKIDHQKHVQGWTNEICGANALAIDEHRALLWGGYRDARSRCIVQEFGDKKLSRPRELTLGFPDGANSKNAQVMGRGATLHAFLNTSWFTFDLHSIE